MAGAWWIGEADLDDDQKDVISLSSEGNHLVLGPPGSGKTNILLLRANYLTLSGKPNIAIVVFTRTLRKFIASGGKQYAFPPDKIMTCNKWQRDLLHQYGVGVNPPTDFAEQRQYMAEKIGELIQKRTLSSVYEAILLDESQDYTPNEIELFKKLGSQLFAVADSRQQIYKSDGNDVDPLAAIRSAVPPDNIHELRYHYRNGLEICKLADRIAKDSKTYQPLTPTAQYKEEQNPSKVTIFQGNLDAQCQQIANALRTQLRAFPKELLAVVCPKREHVNEVLSKLQEDPVLAPRLCKIDDDDDAFDPSKPICVCTVHGAKGLEVRALHFAAADHVKKVPHQRNVGFTAVTRAKTSLAIYHDGDLKGWFESAVEALHPPKAPPTIGALFKGK
ncbi:MAG: AAA family ATPase [Phycisphaerae bacterium]|nr:AAA family ATPase [Phycisphaerae bacterium]